MALVLQTLRGDETLDARCLGVWLLALALWLDFTADHVLANLNFGRTSVSIWLRCSDSASGMLAGEEE